MLTFIFAPFALDRSIVMLFVLKVVGGLTFGIGLIPYAIVLGVTAVAGGTAASTMQWKRPSDSRLIIGDE